MATTEVSVLRGSQMADTTLPATVQLLTAVRHGDVESCWVVWEEGRAATECAGDLKAPRAVKVKRKNGVVIRLAPQRRAREAISRHGHERWGCFDQY